MRLIYFLAMAVLGVFFVIATDAAQAGWGLQDDSSQPGVAMSLEPSAIVASGTSQAGWGRQDEFSQPGVTMSLEPATVIAFDSVLPWGQ